MMDETAEDRKFGVTLKEMIGAGTFGKVFKCRYKSKTYVVKKIRNPEDPQKFKQVVREYVIMNEIRHPRLLQLITYYLTSQDINFILVYMPNGSLKDLLNQFKKQNQKLYESDLLSMFTDIACGLRYLHHRHIIHRDLKPDNILLDEGHRCVLADFGIAKIVKPEEMNHTCIGTIYYMAPEIFKTGVYNHTVDNWALGMIFYEMTMMQMPFKEADRQRIMNDKLTYIVPKIDHLARNYSTHLQDILNLTLQRDPRKRAELSIVVHMQILKKYYTAVKREELKHGIQFVD